MSSQPEVEMTSGRARKKGNEFVNTKEWLDEVSKSSLCSRVTLQATYDAACAVIRNGVRGDFVECGVWAGANSASMARAIWEDDGGGSDECEPDQQAFEYNRAHMQISAKRRVHLFDSFEGIPQAGPHDTEYLEAGHAAGLSKCSIETTKQQMEAWGIPDELLVYHPGWFSDTVASMMQTPIAMLRLDGDLYDSTRVCLEHLYPLLSVGGTVIVDDWTLSGVRRAMQEYFGAPGAPGPVYFHKEA